MAKQGRAPVPNKDQFYFALAQCDKYAHSKRNKAILTTLFTLGLRPKEVACLNIGDVYYSCEQTLYDQLTLLKSHTKGGKIRQLPLANVLFQKYVGEYIALRMEKRNKNGWTTQPDAPLFLSQKGRFSASSMANLCNTLLAVRARIHKASAYSGRRFFATTLVKNKVDLNTIRLLLGHNSLATTQKYIEGDPDTMRNAIASVLSL